jgi:hypothetical protein
MHSGKKALTRWWMAAVLGICLSAGVAQAAGNKGKASAQELAQCEERCTQALEEKTEACMKKCPLPRGGSSEAFETCTRRCVSEASADTCSERCGQAGGAKKSRATQ